MRTRADEIIDCRTNIRKLSLVFGVSEQTMHRFVEEELHYKSYIIQVRMLSKAARTKQVDCCNLHLVSQQLYSELSKRSTIDAFLSCQDKASRML